jgi:hypothetical protein
MRRLASLILAFVPLLAQSPRDQAGTPKLKGEVTEAVVGCQLISHSATAIQCKGANGARTFTLDPKVKVWRGKELDGVATLKPGDNLDVRLRPAARNAMVVTEVWVNSPKNEGARR